MNSELYQPVRFYDASTKQLFRRSMYYDNNFALVVVNKDKLFPFQIERAATEDIITEVSLYDRNDEFKKDITDLLTITRHTNKITDYIRYFASANLSESLPFGEYYLYITDGVNDWYSDLFEIDHLTDTIEFEYHNLHDFAGFLYNDSYQNKFRVRGLIEDIGEYETYKEKIEDFNKNETTTFHKEQKLYRVSVLCDNTLHDAIRIMAMHDTINITNRLDESAQIEISDISTSRFESTRYMELKIKFKIVDDYVIYSDLLENINIVEKLLATKTGKILATKTGKVFKIKRTQ